MSAPDLSPAEAEMVARFEMAKYPVEVTEAAEERRNNPYLGDIRDDRVWNGSAWIDTPDDTQGIWLR